MVAGHRLTDDQDADQPGDDREHHQAGHQRVGGRVDLVTSRGGDLDVERLELLRARSERFELRFQPVELLSEGRDARSAVLQRDVQGRPDERVAVGGSEPGPAEHREEALGTPGDADDADDGDLDLGSVRFLEARVERPEVVAGQEVEGEMPTDQLVARNPDFFGDALVDHHLVRSIGAGQATVDRDRPEEAGGRGRTRGQAHVVRRVAQRRHAGPSHP